ncbi:MAG: ShlB/FhaC/HecB family hemolysin secretion/activation protein [Rhodocyclales bacterium]|nr:ShlB/FhaC/HecB family hemolysin secretion/activation protein [Rhodocyclales bacterium]
MHQRRSANGRFRTAAFFCVGVFACSFVTQTAAQQAPDAGGLRQEIERERIEAPRPPVKPLEPTRRPVTGPRDGELSVNVQAFTLSGNTLVATDRLQAALSGFLRRALSFADLQLAASAVADVYRDEGWVVRTLLPPQDLSSGTVRIEIVEARFGRVRIEGKELLDHLRVGEEHLLGIAGFVLATGASIRSDDVDRVLRLLDELPGVGAQGRLAPGDGDGVTDLVLNVNDKPIVGGDLRIDNHGSRSTGRERLSGNLSIASPLKLSDRLGFYALHTQGSDYVRGAYSLPIGYSGLSAGINSSAMRYRLVGSDFVALQGRGASDTAAVELLYPLLRLRNANATIGAAVERKTFDNESGGAVTSRYAVGTTALTLSGNRQDGFGGGGVWYGNLGLVAGKLDLSGSPNQAADATTTRSAGRFQKLRYALSRQQVVSESLLFTASFSGQLADKNLDSSEKFYLGGGSGLRAYPSSEGGGSEGEMLNLELQWRLPQGFSLSGLYDYGTVLVNKNNSFAGAAALNRYSMRGAGVSFAWANSQGASARLAWARRLGSNPNPTAAGNDQDGTLIRNRIWLEAAHAF